MSDAEIEEKPENKTPEKEKPRAGQPAGKFLFDLNNFDEPEEEEIEEDLPPPPTYYDEDLDKARQEGYQQGKLDGVIESEKKREEFVAKILETISKEVPALFHNEQARYDVFESEVVVLSKALIEAIFPTLADSFALHEITSLIKDVMETHEGEAEIIVEIHPEYQEDIQQQIQEHVNVNFIQGTITVKPNPKLSEGNCFIKWAHGGAFRDTQAITERVLTEMKDILANVPPEKLLAPMTEEEMQTAREAKAAEKTAQKVPQPQDMHGIQPDIAETIDNAEPPASPQDEEIPAEPDPEAIQDTSHKAVDLSGDMAHNQESSDLPAAQDETDELPEIADETTEDATTQSLDDAVDDSDAPKDDGDTR